MISVIFKDIRFLWLLPLVAITVLYFFVYGRREASFKFSSGNLVLGMRSSFKLRLSRYLIFLRAFALFLIAIALARPISPLEETEITKEGVDIVLAIDVSSTMLAEDFHLKGRRVNRISVVLDVVKEFINSRENDRIGIVAFAGRAYTVSPLTLDHTWLEENMERVNVGLIEDGTAIGSGIMASLNRLKDTKAKSKIVILLTDGRNNAGKISPITAAEIAKKMKIKIYAIGAGAKGLAPYPVKDRLGNVVYKPIQVDIDDQMLEKIADFTGGKYFRAYDTDSLIEIYHEIDKLEKTKVEQKGYLEFDELFHYFLIPGIIILMFEIFLSNTIFRKIP